MNFNNDAYWESRGYEERPEDWEISKVTAVSVDAGLVLLRTTGTAATIGVKERA